MSITPARPHAARRPARALDARFLAAPAAIGEGYGRGLFTGKADSQFENDCPKTPIEIKVKGKRAASSRRSSCSTAPRTAAPFAARSRPRSRRSTTARPAAASTTTAR